MGDLPELQGHDAHPEGASVLTILDAVLDGLERDGWRIVRHHGDIEHPMLRWRADWSSAVAERTGKRIVITADGRGDIQSFRSVSDASVP